ncbi:MaoC/PaaZ C-terminal domain-containing protein [Actinomadura sp. B10D3]|uniref:MaoC/PaaZ C-terminal domain-containing protein n=1 Tax=Actinomadura sp. B10D3 TaxID=3153557 RepID=UPI00325DEED7
MRDVKVGDVAEPRVFGPIDRTDIVRYAGASGDFNPIHHDEEFARSAGFPTVFSIGMLHAALLATYATDWLGTDNVVRHSVRFREQVWPGDVLTCSGTVTEVDAGTVTVDLLCTGQAGAVVVSGTAVFRRENGR